MPPVHTAGNLLDLELMHQWSTVTYKSFCGPKEDEYPTWQVIIPQESFRCSFLLHGLLAAASLEIAATNDRPNHADYVSAALEHHDIALRTFRSELTDIPPEKQQAMLAFSTITMVLGLALPRFTKAWDETQSMIEHMVAHFELLHRIGTLTVQNWEVLRKAPILRNIPLFHELALEPLEPNIVSAITRLNNLNEQKHNAALYKSQTAKLQTITYHAACQKAILNLEEYFAKCRHPIYRCYTLAWLNMNGRDFIAAVEHADPVALLALMYWGVLAEKSSDGIWWARSIGQSLVEEITIALSAENDPLLRTCVSWVREQMGL